MTAEQQFFQGLNSMKTWGSSGEVGRGVGAGGIPGTDGEENK